MVRDNALTAGLVAVNLATGLAGAIIGKLLRDIGFDVVRPRDVDGDPFVELYPGYAVLRSGARQADAAELGQLLADADVCVLGGEDCPGLIRDRESAQTLAGRHRRLVIVNIEACHPAMAEASRPAVDLLAQARSGLVFEHYHDRPNVMSFQPAQYGAALQGCIGMLAALIAREANGRGQIVSTSFFEGALAWSMPWCATENPDRRFSLATPMEPRPLILRCKDGSYIHIVFGAAGAKYNLYKILGIDDPTVLPGDPGIAKPTDPPEKFFGDVDLIGSFVAQWQREPLLDALEAAGVTAAPVLESGQIWNDAQVRHLGLVKSLDDGTRCVAGVILVENVDAGVRLRPADTALPLAGVRALDFGAFVAGPSALLPLEGLGADVIKIEPLSGDPSRGLPRAFRASNRGKRSIALDMKSEAGAQIVQKLCAGAAIVASNFRGGVAAKLGIDAASLHQRSAHLIVLDSSPFGPSGPRARQGAFDLTIQALCGHEWRAGGNGNVPIWNRTFLGDYGGGMLGTIALLGSLLDRVRTGRGASLDVSLLGAGLFLMSELVQRPDGSFAGGDALNAQQTGLHPAEGLYRAQGEWVALVVRSAAMARGLARVLGLEGRLHDRWREWGDGEQALLRAAIEQREAAAFIAAAEKEGVWIELCRRNMRERIFADEILARAGITTRIADPTYRWISVLGSTYRMSVSAQKAATREPALGEHSRQILGELGYSDSEIDLLIEQKIIRVP